MKIKDLTKGQLWELRQEIELNSVYLRDYSNSFDIEEKECFTFFNGYIEYLLELENTDNGLNQDLSEILELYDNAENLYNWFACIVWDD